jgi:hypothetical protein
MGCVGSAIHCRRGRPEENLGDAFVILLAPTTSWNCLETHVESTTGIPLRLLVDEGRQAKGRMSVLTATSCTERSRSRQPFIVQRSVQRFVLMTRRLILVAAAFALLAFPAIVFADDSTLEVTGPDVRVLTDANFEHDTQAASGNHFVFTQERVFYD